MSHQPRFCAAPNFFRMGIKYLNLSSFILVSTIKDEKSAAEFYYTTTVRSSGINILAGGDPFLPETLAQSDSPPPEGSEF